MTAMHLWHVCTVARWLTCSASAFASEPDAGFLPGAFPWGPRCTTTADCTNGSECMPHEWPRPRKGGAVEIGRTCETACRSEEDCPKGKSCLMIDHGPRSSTGSLCLNRLSLDQPTVLLLALRRLRRRRDPRLRLRRDEPHP